MNDKFYVRATDSPVPAGKEPDADKLIPRAFETLDAALEASFTLINQGGVVWRISGPNGFLMERNDIERRKYEAHR